MCKGRRKVIARNKVSMKSTNSILLTLLVLSVALLAFTKTAGQARITKSLDSDWRFLKSDSPGAEAQNFDDTSWRRLNVPHDWSIEGPFDAQNPTGGAGGFLPG